MCFYSLPPLIAARWNTPISKRCRRNWKGSTNYLTASKISSTTIGSGTHLPPNPSCDDTTFQLPNSAPIIPNTGRWHRHGRLKTPSTLAMWQVFHHKVPHPAPSPKNIAKLWFLPFFQKKMLITNGKRCLCNCLDARRHPVPPHDVYYSVHPLFKKTTRITKIKVGKWKVGPSNSETLATPPSFSLRFLPIVLLRCPQANKQKQASVECDRIPCLVETTIQIVKLACLDH